MATADVSRRAYPFIVGGTRLFPAHPLSIRSPYSGEEVGVAGEAAAFEVQRALDAAAAARPAMSALDGAARRQALLELEARVREHQDEFAALMANEAAKPLRDARGEVQRALVTLRAAAEAAANLEDRLPRLDASPGGAGKLAILRRFPLGLVAGVTPFNFPLNLVLHKLAPALAAGNSVILKLSPRAPLTGLLLGELALACDLPPGAVNVLSGGAEPVGQILADQRLALFSFTGSAEVGWPLKARAGRARVVLELGGNAANIVHLDADLAAAAEKLVAGAFRYAGQSCISVQRVLAHASIYDDLRDRLVAGAQRLRLGDPLDAATDVGPMITEAAARRAAEWVGEALALGARLLAGGHCDGGFFEPTVLENVPFEARIWREEAFAPVLALKPYADISEAIAEANASRYGLQAGLFTRDLDFIRRAFRELEVGGLIVNEASSFRLDPMPYGGVKDSGFGREGVRYAIEEMSEPRLLLF